MGCASSTQFEELFVRQLDRIVFLLESSGQLLFIHHVSVGEDACFEKNTIRLADVGLQLLAAADVAHRLSLNDLGTLVGSMDVERLSSFVECMVPPMVSEFFALFVS